MSNSSSRSPLSVLRGFLDTGASGGIILVGVAALALVVANAPTAPYYFALLEVQIGGMSLLHWINDALMAVFFLLVGLEIKRELVDGQLSTWSRRLLPGIAAVGGMAVPALIYVVLNATEPVALRGWAIPSATDIAFSLGILALLGSRVPVSLKIFLTALAIIDDLGAVAIIAAFYTDNLKFIWLAAATGVIAVLFSLNHLKFRHVAFYLVPGALLWLLVLRSGVHPTLAGVALAFTIPVKSSPGHPDEPTSPLHILEHAIQPWVAFLIVPVFGFANAGVSLSGSWPALFEPITLGVAAGLFFGKQIGVFACVWLTVRFGLAERPQHASWPQVYGVSILAGIGFTMSLFIGLLAFASSPELQNAIKIGVLAGSVLSAVTGLLVLLFASAGASYPDHKS